MRKLMGSFSWIVGMILAASPLSAQINVLQGTALGTSLNLGIDTYPSHIFNWLSVEAPPPAPGDLKMVCPAAQICYMFITDGPALSTYPRPGIDVSVYQYLTVEIEGDPGTTIQVGIKDATQPDDGTEATVTLPVTSNWTTYTIPLSRFAVPVGRQGGYVINLHNIYAVFEIIFPGAPQSQTAKVRTITYSVAPPSQPYYFSDYAFAENWESTLTYINYSPQTVTCTTNFYGDNGLPLAVPFAQGSVVTRTDVLAPGGSIHDPTTAPHTGSVVQGWAQANCTGPVQASMLFRQFNAGVPIAEAGVNAETAPTTEFATFAQTATGIAYANPSTTQSATITFTAYNNAGVPLGSQSITLGPLAHGASNIGPLLGLASFTGFVKITSTIPIISLSMNFEVAPIFSSLPPGDLPGSTTLVTP